MADARGLCCLVCYNVFKSDDDQFIPRNLNCGHTYCSGCLRKLASQCHGMSIRCPTCKTETSLYARVSGVSSLPKNFGVLEILESKTDPVACWTALTAGGIESEKDRNKWLCPEHDEALKVFCFTDNCLICIYCQVYGSHTGHKCELASNIARDAREQLRRASKKLGEIYDTVSKAKKKVVETKDNLVDTQEYLKIKIKKHHGVLRTCLSRRELALKASVDDKTKTRLEPIEAQESMMTEILEKTDKAYSLIKKCESNDGAMVEDKKRIERLIVEVSDLYQRCEMDPKSEDNLAYRFEYDTCCTLETKVGKIIEVDTEGLEEQPRENPALQGKPPEPEPSNSGSCVGHVLRQRVEQELPRCSTTFRSLPADHISGIHLPNPLPNSTDQAEPCEVDCNSVGAEGGLSSGAEEVTDHDKERQQSDQLLQEIQQEIDRLKLLGPEGNRICLTEERRPEVDELLDVIDGDYRRVQVDFETRFSETFKGPQLTHTARPGMAELREVRRPGQPLYPAQEVAVASQEPPAESRGMLCSAVDCRQGALVQCSYCADAFCVNCALPICTFPCKRDSQGQHNFDYILTCSRQSRSSERSAGGERSQSRHTLEKEEEWECGLCTMINQPHVLACVACKKTRGVDSMEGHKICPMCTLVNKPGAVKCELCETNLVPPQDSICVSDDDCTGSDE